MQGLLGKKIGMTRVFDGAGHQVPVTVIEAGPCVVLQRKTQEKDGYDSIQVGFGVQAESRVNKSLLGHFKSAGVAPVRYLKEFISETGDAFKPGESVTAKIFEGVGFVDIEGVTKGKGFQGVMRRHNMRGGPVTHGGHSKRRIGSIGCRELPGRVHKGKRMPGHMGNVWVTQQNLRVVQVRAEENLLLVEGSVPGANGSVVVVKRSLKKGAKAS